MWLAAKASIHTLGCRLNQADSGLMADALRRRGYTLVPWGEPAELLVVNSCTVTSSAAHKTRQAVRAARRRHPEAFIVVVGCDVDVSSERWQQETAADLVLPNAGKQHLAALLPDCLVRGTTPRLPTCAGATDAGTFMQEGYGFFPERTRANLKVQDGCDFCCTYCIVPRARGPARSRVLADVIREARELAAAGYKELVLTGVNIASYREQERTLADLLLALLDIAGDFRIRLSSTEPGSSLLDVLDVMAQSKRICRFLHLPMQYGEDSILQAMKRRYAVEEYAEFAHLAVGRIPGLCLGSDIIVGFPGETEATFGRCVQTVMSLPLGHLHVFSYSPRPGTGAAALPGRVPKAVAAQRSQRLATVAASKSMEFAERHIGQALTVLTEACNKHGRWEGWSDNYLRVEVVDGPGELSENEFVKVRVVAVSEGRAVQGVVTRDEPV